MFVKGQQLESVNDGVFHIVSDNGWDKVVYRFPSGWERVGTRQQVSRGMVKDYFKPIYFGVGFIGGRKYKTKKNNKNCTAYSRWKLMIKRCYFTGDEKYHNYGGAGVYVCDEWHNFQNYAEWFYTNYINGCDVDKDILSGESKVYSPGTCCFVSHQDNCDFSFSKTFKFIDPNGDVVEVRNLAKFCRDKNLTRANMNKVLNGERSHHKGYKKLPTSGT
ncbi:MAG: hypothetical protein WA981_09125 [Glaciecola sp.]